MAVEILGKIKQKKSNGGVMAVALHSEIQVSVARSGVL